MPFQDPYALDDSSSASAPCEVVSYNGLTYSLTYNTYFDRFIAVGHANHNVPENGFYYMLSDDLVHWSDLHLLMPVEFAYTTSEAPYYAYPSLIDHNSPSLSFDVGGQDLYLYFTRFNSRDFTDGDMLRVKVHFEKEE